MTIPCRNAKPRVLSCCKFFNKKTVRFCAGRFLAFHFVQIQKEGTLRVLSFCEKIYLGKNIEGTKILFSEGGNEVMQDMIGQTQGSYSSNAAQYITNDRVGVVAQ